MIFIGQLLSKKFFGGKFDGKLAFYSHSQKSKKFPIRKNYFYVKVTVLVLISHFKGMLTVIFKIINFNEEQQVINN